jgi:hypothetical protein
MYISDTVLRIGKGGCSGVVKNVISSTILRHNTDHRPRSQRIRLSTKETSQAESLLRPKKEELLCEVHLL